jgi:hypothetical protein
MPKSGDEKNNTRARKKAQEKYKKIYKELKPFLVEKHDLRKPFTQSEKIKLTAQYKEFERLTAGKPYDLQIYRARDSKKLKSAQAMGGMNQKINGFKVAFIPKTSPQQKVKFKKSGEAYTVGEFVASMFIPIDPEFLAADGRDYIDELVKNRKENVFGIKTGKYELHGTFSRDRVAAKVAELMGRYSNHAEWLEGITAYEFDNQANLDEYRNRKRAAQIKRDRASARREKNKKIKLFYFYDRQLDEVSLSKNENSSGYPITKKQYENFLRAGKI